MHPPRHSLLLVAASLGAALALGACSAPPSGHVAAGEPKPHGVR